MSILNPKTWFKRHDQKEDAQTKLLAEIAKQLGGLDARLDVLEDHVLKHGRKLADEVVKNSIDSDARVAALVKVLSAEIAKQLRLSEEALGSETFKLGEVLAKQIREVVKHIPDANALAKPLHDTEVALAKVVLASEAQTAAKIASLLSAQGHDFESLFNRLNSDHDAVAASAKQLADSIVNALVELDRQTKSSLQGYTADLNKKLDALKPLPAAPEAFAVMPSPVAPPKPVAPAPVRSADLPKPSSEAAILVDLGVKACEETIKKNLALADRALFDVQMVDASGAAVRIVPSGSPHETLGAAHRAAPFKVVHALFTPKQAARLKELLAKKG